MEWGGKRKESPKYELKTGTVDVREPHVGAFIVGIEIASFVHHKM